MISSRFKELTVGYQEGLVDTIRCKYDERLEDEYIHHLWRLDCLYSLLEHGIFLKYL